VREKEFAMMSHLAVEQLEERCVPAAHVVATPPADTTIPAVVQAVRGHVDRVDPATPAAAAIGAVQVPPSPLAVNAPQIVPIDNALLALPTEMSAMPELDAANVVLEVSIRDEPVMPERPAEAPPAVVVVVTTVEREAGSVVPAAADWHVEPVRAPTVPLARLANERVAPETAARHDHLPMLVWMIGMASLVALRAERRWTLTSACACPAQPDR
jgi:hypothetical protein